jgi:DNA-binding SARP family transcriptional activator
MRPTPLLPRPRFRLSVLGEFALERDGQELRVPPQSQRLLVMLALEGRPVRRAGAAWRLWPDSPESRAASNLRAALWKLGDAAAMVIVDRADLSLASDVIVDVAALRADAAALRGGILPARLELDRLGLDLLPWWYDDWLVIERERLRQLRLHALENASSLLVARHQYDAALDAALLAVGCDELRESAHRCIVRAHLAEGNIGEAMRQRDRYVAALRAAGLPARVSAEMDTLLADAAAWT